MRQHQLVFGHGTVCAEDEAAWLLSFACRLNPAQIVASPGRLIDSSQLQRADALIAQRIAKRIPAAYIVGEAWQCGVRFKVDERVLIPRSYIGELLPTLGWLVPKAPRRILDLCSGSGCLGILAARQFKRARVDLADLSESALEVASVNIKRFRLGHRVRSFRSDLFKQVRMRSYDLIVTNPPYVKTASMKRLPPEYQAEPRLALAGGTQGLDLVSRILADAGSHLSDDGILLMEIGHNKAALERRYPKVAFIWLQTTLGAAHVVALEARQLKKLAGG